MFRPFCRECRCDTTDSKIADHRTRRHAYQLKTMSLRPQGSSGSQSSGAGCAMDCPSSSKRPAGTEAPADLPSATPARDRRSLRDVNSCVARQALRRHQIHFTHRRYEAYARKDGRWQRYGGLGHMRALAWKLTMPAAVNLDPALVRYASTFPQPGSENTNG